MIPITSERYIIQKQEQISQLVLFQEGNKFNKLLLLNTTPPILYLNPVMQVMLSILAINRCILVVIIKKNNSLISVLLVTDRYVQNVLFTVHIKNTKYKQQEKQ